MINTDAPFYQTETQISEDWKNVTLAKQDISKFSFIYDKYYVSVFRFVYQRVDSIDNATDITSLVFLKTMQSIKKFEFKGLPFASILFRIAYNEVNQHFRTEKKERNFYLNLNYENNLAIDITINEDEDKANNLKKLLEYLTPSELELIEMRYFEKRSYKEIAEITNITENNAKVKVHRILGKLKSTAVKYHLAELLIAIISCLIINI